MSEMKLTRLNKVLREFNISLDRAVEFLASSGHIIEARPTTKISESQYNLFLDEFSSDKSSKVESHDLSEEKKKQKEELRLKLEKEQEEKIKKQNELIKAKVEIKKLALVKNDYDKIYHVLLMNHFLKITILTKMPSEKCLVLSPLLFSFGEKSINTVR